MSDRVVAVLLLIVVLAYGIQGWSYVPEGFTDILGARTFPLAIAVFMVPLTVVLFIEGHSASGWPSPSIWLVVIVAAVTLTVYAYVIGYLGFFLATIPVFIVFGILFHARWWQGLLAGVIGSVVLYVLLVQLLDLYLPPGPLLEEWF